MNLYIHFVSLLVIGELTFVKAAEPPSVPFEMVMEFRTSYQTLVRLTALPDEHFDPAGKALPKDFLSYRANENTQYDQFVAALSPEGTAAFNSLKRAFSKVGIIELVKMVATISQPEKPSSFDFIISNILKDQIREYPPAYMFPAAQEDLVQQWSLLSQSPNPVFRLLSLEEANRVIQDKTVALALLKMHTEETDSTIVQALIDQLALIGNDGAKEVLKQVSEKAPPST